MKNRSRGILAVIGSAFMALCLVAPSPATAADGDLLVMIETPTQTCVPGQANDTITGYKIVSGLGAVDIAPTGWQPVDSDGVSIQTFEVQIYGEGYVYAEGSWKGGTFTDDGSTCGQAPELTVIAEPTRPGYVDDDTKQGDSAWIVPADTAEHTWTVNDKGELIAYPGDGFTYGEHEFVNFGVAPDAYNPPIPTPTDPTTPPDNGGGTDDDGDDGNTGGGDDNGGNTPPTSTPDTTSPGTGGAAPSNGSDDKSSADTSKDGKKATSTTSQVRRPGHNGAVADSDTLPGPLGWSVLAFGLTLIGAGYWKLRKHSGSI